MAKRASVGTEWADVNGATLAYDVAGDGPWLVLVHAGIADRRMWEPQMRVLADKYRVLRYDLRGFGESAMPPGAFSRVDDLIGLLDAVGVGRAAFVGCSMGGSTVLDAALAHPDRVAALVIVGSTPSGFPRGEDDQPRQAEAVEAAWEANDLERASELEVQIWVDGPQRAADAVDPAVRDLVRAMNLIALQTEKAALGEEREPPAPAYGRVETIDAPTLVVSGDLDQPRSLRGGAYLAETIPGARLEMVGGTAHLPNLERPAAFNRIVLDFLDSSVGSDATPSSAA